MSDIGFKSGISALDAKAGIPSKMPKLAGLKDEKLWKAAKEFESMFMDTVMKSMRSSTAMESDVMGDSDQVKMFQEMLDTEHSKAAGQEGKFGLANAIYRQFSRQQLGEVKK